MLKRGILNAQLRSMLARIGHRDYFAIVDAGYNVPAGIETVDLAFLPSIPPILPVLDGVLDEMCIEQVILAEEIKHWAPELNEAYAQRWSAKAEVVYMPHGEFDLRMQGVKGVIRTGQYGTHASNIILRAGCAFDE